MQSSMLRIMITTIVSTIMVECMTIIVMQLTHRSLIASCLPGQSYQGFSLTWRVLSWISEHIELFTLLTPLCSTHRMSKVEVICCWVLPMLPTAILVPPLPKFTRAAICLSLGWSKIMQHFTILQPSLYCLHWLPHFHMALQVPHLHSQSCFYQINSSITQVHS